MPIPKLTFLDKTAGIPRKPIALRYAIRIAGLEVGTMCALLTGELHYFNANDEKVEPLLVAYEVIGGASARRVAPQTIATIYSEIPAGTQSKGQLKQIPKSFYVWSNDLAEAFQHYINLVPGRENADEWNLALNWNPALGPYKYLIDECPNPENAGSPRAQLVAIGEARNKKIIAAYHKLKKEFPQLSKSRLATLIAKRKTFDRFSRRVPKSLSPESIRRILNRYL